jgi:hypothetical protein
MGLIIARIMGQAKQFSKTHTLYFYLFYLVPILGNHVVGM